jgi:hypothetical protein
MDGRHGNRVGNESLGKVLHFQRGRFLANCAAMSHGDSSLSSPQMSLSGSVPEMAQNGALGQVAETGSAAVATTVPDLAPEIGGREGPEPTRYGDWEKAGRCIDF